MSGFAGAAAEGEGRGGDEARKEREDEHEGGEGAQNPPRFARGLSGAAARRRLFVGGRLGFFGAPGRLVAGILGLVVPGGLRGRQGTQGPTRRAPARRTAAHRPCPTP